eukprot:GEMP01007557.1.p1 GENE.GEMP01007557.1~~GEMP01007557.1.p1  ORF type:complete len:553 (+),score=103.06 GEMP01007557.1:67-1725(+)
MTTRKKKFSFDTAKSGDVFTPRTYTSIKLDLANTSDEVTTLVERLRRQITSRGATDAQSDVTSSADAGFVARQRKDMFAGTVASDEIVVGGRAIKEKDISSCRATEVRVDARLAFSRLRAGVPPRFLIPLCGTAEPLLTRVDTQKLRAHCYALRQAGCSNFDEVKTAFLKRQKANVGQAGPTTLTPILTTTRSLPTITETGVSLKPPEEEQNVGAAVQRMTWSDGTNFVSRNKRKSALRYQLPEVRLAHLKESIEESQNRAAQAYVKRFAIHTKTMRLSSLHFEERSGVAAEISTVQVGSDWRTNMNALLFLTRTHRTMVRLREMRRVYAIERRWMLPVRVWRWCRKLRRRTGVSKRWSFLWKFIRVLCFLYKRRNKHRAITRIKHFIGSFGRSQRIRLARFKIRKTIDTIQRNYRLFSKNIQKLLTVTNRQFQEQELKYLYQIFQCCSKADIFIADSGAHIGENEKGSEEKKESTSACQEIIVAEPYDAHLIPANVMQKLKTTVEAHRLRPEFRRSLVHREIIRRMYARSAVQNRNGGGNREDTERDDQNG